MQARLEAGSASHENLLLLAESKTLDLSDPGLSFDVSDGDAEWRIAVSSASFAPYVWLRLAGDPALPADQGFSDNFFHLPAGETKRVTLSKSTLYGSADAVKAAAQRADADVRSIPNPFPACCARACIGKGQTQLIEIMGAGQINWIVFIHTLRVLLRRIFLGSLYPAHHQQLFMSVKVFRCPLMYKPNISDSIPVPLRCFNWFWSADVANNNNGNPFMPNWQITSSNNSVNPSDTDCTTYQTWTHRELEHKNAYSLERKKH